MDFKSLIILIFGFRNVFCCLAWAVDLVVQITDEGRNLYIRPFCPAMTSLSRYLEEAGFSISISSSVFIFLWLFSRCIMDNSIDLMSFVKDMFREFGFVFCVSEIFPLFFKSCIKVSIGSSYIKCVALMYEYEGICK